MAIRGVRPDDRGGLTAGGSEGLPAGGNAPLLFLVVCAAIMIPAAQLLRDSMIEIPGSEARIAIVALLVFVPLGLATVFRFLESGLEGAGALFRRLLPDRYMGWKFYAFALLAMPVAQFVAYLAAAAMGREYDRYTPLSALTLAFPILIFAIAEEAGWTGYVTEPLQRRWGALAAAVAIGAFGALIHIGPYLQAGHDWGWIAAQSLQLVGMRILIVWTFNKCGKSIFPAIMIHGSYNLAYIMYPYNGSHYDPLLLSAVLWAVALAILFSTHGRLGYRASPA